MHKNHYQLANKQMDLALCHFQAGRYGATEQICQTVLGNDPAHLEALYLLAQIAAKREQYEAAASMVAEVCRNVTNKDILANYCLFHQKAKKQVAALSFLRGMVLQDPDDYDIWYHLGLVCLDVRELDGAEQAFIRASRLQPDNPEPYYQMAEVRQRSFLSTEALKWAQMALSRAPDAHGYKNFVACLLKRLGRADEAVEYFEQTLALAPGSPAYRSNYLMNFLCTTRFPPEHVFSEHSKWAAQYCKEAGEPYGDYANSCDPDRRIRIGYVSADFYRHPVAFFIEPVLSLHDREVVEVYLYASVEKPDEVTEQIRQRPCVWRDILDKSNLDVCRMIRDDGIDILIDLNGHTKASRLPIFSKKPAPVQVTWLGYADTSGLPTMDYRLTDAAADPPGMTERYHSETLYRMPLSFICYHPPINPPDLTVLPFSENGFVTFGAFNNFAKLNSSLVALWSRVLQRVPGARLMLKEKGLVADKGLRSYLFEQFAASGITSNRLLLIERKNTLHEHLETLGQADIALDSFPYSGTTTTCESLWMGVPVVTMAGPVHVSRVSASLLTAVGVPELIAKDGDEFVEIAVRLAHDRQRLMSYRHGLRKMMQQSPLMDIEGFTNKLERAYRDMWRQWCLGQGTAGRG